MTFVGGLLAFRQLNIEAYPDPTPPMVDVITQSPGLSAEEIERYITIPIETQTSALAQSQHRPHHFAVRPFRREAAIHVRLHLRRGAAAGSQSAVAAAAAAEQRAAADFAGQPDRRNLPLQARRPAELHVLDLKTLQDWVLQRRFRAVPGVIDVTGWGGKTKTYELQIDINKLIAYGITLPQMQQTLEQQQHQRRRQHDQYRPAGRGGSRRRPDPLARRNPQHHADADPAACR